MFVQKAFIEDLKARNKALEDDNHRLMNSICQLVGISTPFPVIQPPAPAILSGRKTWEVRKRELEAKEASGGN